MNEPALPVPKPILLLRRRQGARLRLVLVLGVALSLTGGALFAFIRANSFPEHTAVHASSTVTIPLPEPVKPDLMPLTRDQAVAVNSEIPIAVGPLEPARPFRLLAEDYLGAGRRSALECLTAAVYYEAASEGGQGQRSVAQVVLNRLRHPAFPKSVCGVVYQGSERATGCQFSFTCDGSLFRRPSRVGWDRARKIASMALAGAVEPAVGMATHYHADYVVPYWASTLDKVAKIGVHIFYRWRGYWGRRTAFTGRYAGEPAESGGLDLATLAVPLERDLLIDEDMSQTTVLRQVPTGPRPLADEVEHLAQQPVKAADGGAGALRADRERGTLAADEPPVLVVPTGQVAEVRGP